MEQLRSKKGDWHRAQVLAELKMKGLSLAEVSRSSGLASRTLNNVFYRTYPKGQEIIAKALGKPAVAIWPSRYIKQVV